MSRKRLQQQSNQVFSKISITDFEQLFKINQSTNESAAIQEILNQFSKYFLRFGNHIERGNLNEYVKFKTIIVENNPEYMRNRKFYCSTRPIYLWLTNVYNFSGYFASVETKIYEVVLNRFLGNFIKDCRDHNVRVLAKSIKSKKENEEKIIDNYFLAYDKNLVDKDNFLSRIKSLSLVR